MSSLRASWLSSAVGELNVRGEVGDALFGECDVDAVTEVSSASSWTSELFLDLAPIKLFFNLNFSSQLVLSPACASGLFDVAEKAWALCRIASSDNANPFFSCHGLAINERWWILWVLVLDSLPTQQGRVRYRVIDLSVVWPAIDFHRLGKGTSPFDGVPSKPYCIVKSAMILHHRDV